MRIILNIIVSALLVSAPLFCAAQSLQDYMAGNTALTARTEPEEKPKAQEAPAEQAPSNNVMAVTHLPDVKLNNAVISKTVLTYFNGPELKEAQTLYENGEQSKALEVYEKLSADESFPAEARVQAALNTAVINLQRAEYKNALKNADLALKLNPNNPFAQLLKVWIYSAWGKTKEAKKEAENLLFLTADFEYLSSSKLALAQAYFNAGKKNEAMEILQNLYGTDPYLISHAAYLMGRLSAKNKPAAQALSEQALSHDGNNYSAQKYQAEIQYKLKQYIPAWQSYASLFILDKNDKKSAKRLKKLSKKLKGAPENYLFYTKLSEIYTKKPEPSNSEAVRVGLFSDYKANLTPLQSFNFMPGSDFTIKDEALGAVISGEAYTPKNISFDKEHQGVHIQNKWGAADFSTKRPFVISLNKEGYSFLVKDAKAEDIFSANLGDKELKGSLLVIPTEKGMILVNYTSLDDVLPSLVMSLTRGIKAPAALEAAATVLRTALVRRLSYSQDAIFDISDNAPRLNYGGVNMESQFVREASKNTKGKVLAQVSAEQTQAEPAQAEIYRSCSSASEDGIRNTKADISYSFSPVNLFKFMISNPPKDLYSAPEDPTLWSSVKWAYLMPLKEIETRLNSLYKIGALKYFEPAKTTPYGRIETMRFAGSKKTVEVPFEEANFILAAGTLKSPFFTFIPFKKDVLIFGSDTGAGKGLCIDGAYGLAKKGKTAEEILKYYYPDLEITEKWQIKKSLL